MSFEQRAGSAFNHPAELGGGEMIAQGTKHGQGVEYVANGGEANDEDSWLLGHRAFRLVMGGRHRGSLGMIAEVAGVPQ